MNDGTSTRVPQPGSDPAGTASSPAAQSFQPGPPPPSLNRGAVLASAAYLALITGLARSSGLDLLLFPELAALTTVVIGMPAHPWARSPRLLVLTPALTGTLGIALARQLPYGPLAVGLVVTASLLLVRLLRSPVIPALSAGLLPLALGLQSWLYPLALLPGTLGLALLIQWRRGELWRYRPWRRPGSLSDGPEQAVAAAVSGLPLTPLLPPLRLWLGPLLLFLAGALLLVRLLGSPLVFYPPLLVLAWETLARPDHCPWRGRSGAILTATGLAALIGLLLVRWLGPMPLATVLSVLLVALLLARLRLTCPPAFAVALLPFVVPAPTVAFPLHVLAGTAWLVVVSALAAGLRRRRRGRECAQ